ncbi:hypothetical protein P3T23_003552 [Paraburkholderia sp. GAS448]|uniref:P-loop ATPase, Sll1717 family n=1 Tax=Paraburkholderia sp. GAS448 TaxID=3035136 RepID=UPI003D25FE16
MGNQLVDVQVKLGDRTLFGNDAAEDEDAHILNSYFLNQPKFSRFLDHDVRFMIALARKGMGKSALLNHFAYQLSELQEKPLIVLTRPSSLTGLLPPPDSKNDAILENYWRQVICKAINLELAGTIGFAWSDDSMALVENAELAGFKNKNLIGALTSRLLGKINLFGAIELSKNSSPIQNNPQVLRRIQDECGKVREVWFLLDDIDANFTNTPEQQAYIASFFNASRNIVRDIRGVSIRATVRTDVWAGLQLIEFLDKSDQYLCEIKWSIKQQEDLLVRRVSAYVNRTFPNSQVARKWTNENNKSDYLELVFAKRLKWGDSAAPPINVLRSFAAGRPRWMVQLCRLAGDEATINGVTRIGSNEINLVMPSFGRLRLSDLYREHQRQFEDLKKVVELFSNGSSRFDTNELLEKIFKLYIKRRSAASIPDVDGEPFKDSLQIARFLFKCGFIVARNPKEGSLEAPAFVSFELRPDLLSVDTNLDDGMSWEIQIPYRKALNIR